MMLTTEKRNKISEGQPLYWWADIDDIRATCAAVLVFSSFGLFVTHAIAGHPKEATIAFCGMVINAVIFWG